MKKIDWIYLALILVVIAFFVKIFSRQDLNLIHLRNMSLLVRIKFSNFLNDIKKLGYTPVIRESVRTHKQQQAYYKKDKRNARPGHSEHEFAKAIDLDLYKNGKVLSKNSPRASWIISGVPALAKQHGIRWGGTFKGYADNNHFDLKT